MVLSLRLICLSFLCHTVNARYLRSSRQVVSCNVECIVNVKYNIFLHIYLFLKQFNESTLKIPFDLMKICTTYLLLLVKFNLFLYLFIYPFIYFVWFELFTTCKSFIYTRIIYMQMNSHLYLVKCRRKYVCLEICARKLTVYFM